MSVSFGGLASGLDTNSILDQLMAVEAQPQVRLQRQQKVVQARSDLLRDIASRMRSLRSAAASLQSSATWANVQTATSGDTSRLGVSITGGAGPGGYQVDVTQLARAEQRTYTYTPSGGASQITVGAYTLDVAAGATLDDVVAALNSDATSPVSAVNVSGQLVLSSRTTGVAGGFTASGGTLVEDAAKARAGLNAQGTVDGVAFSSSTNTVSTAIPGVTLTLQGVTTTTGPITVNVTAPSLDKSKVESAAKAFVESYNSLVTFVSGKLKEQRIANPKTDSEALKGLVFGDSMLAGVLSGLRSSMSDPVTGNPAALDQLSELGISTGATTGESAINPDAVTGLLTLDSAKLSAALDSDPISARRLLAGDATTTGIAGRVQTLVDGAAGTGGTIEARTESANRQLSTIRSQLADMERRLTAKRKLLQAQFTAMESAMSANQSQSAWLQGQIGALSSGSR